MSQIYCPSSRHCKQFNYRKDSIILYLSVKLVLRYPSVFMFAPWRKSMKASTVLKAVIGHGIRSGLDSTDITNSVNVDNCTKYGNENTGKYGNTGIYGIYCSTSTVNY